MLTSIAWEISGSSESPAGHNGCWIIYLLFIIPALFYHPHNILFTN